MLMDGNVKGHNSQINNWNNGNRNGVSIEQMFTRKDGQFKTQNQALEEMMALQFAEQHDIAKL